MPNISLSKRLASALLVVVLSSVIGSFYLLAQNPAPKLRTAEEIKADRKALEQNALRLLDELISEIAYIKYPNYRIDLLIQAVDILWEYDEVRARSIVSDITNQINSAINHSLSDPTRDVSRIPRVRSNMIDMLAEKDVDFALEFLKATRIPIESDYAKYMGNNDDSIEMSLIARAAKKDPDRALEFAREKLKNRFNDQVLDIFESLAEKSPSHAVRLSKIIIDRLKTTDFYKDYAELSAAIGLVDSMRSIIDWKEEEKEKKKTQVDVDFRPHAGELLSLLIGATAKLDISSLIEPGQGGQARMLLTRLEPMLPFVRKVAPGSANQLKAKLNQFDKYLVGYSHNLEYLNYGAEILDKTFLESVAIADGAPEGQRHYLYMSAISRVISDSDREAAVKIIKERFGDSPAGRELLQVLEAHEAERLANLGRFNEAMKVLSSDLPDIEKARALAEWACAASLAGDISGAQNLVHQAQMLMGDKMSTGRQVGVQLLLAEAMIRYDSDRSFLIANNAVERLNRVTSYMIEVGEFFVDDRPLGFEAYGIYDSGNLDMVGLLAESIEFDFERADNLLRRIEPGEVRVKLGVDALQKILAVKKTNSSFRHPLRGSIH